MTPSPHPDDDRLATRRERLSLDGAWDFRLEGHGGWRTAVVPGPWQAQFADLREASGVALYARDITIPDAWRDREVIIRFGAASYFAEVSLDGVPIGSHEGGYLPFECVVPTEALQERHRLEVRVTLPDGDTQGFPESPFQEIPHGKQSWYGPLGGLWQSVLLEARDPRHVGAVGIRADLVRRSVVADVDLSCRVDGVLEARVRAPDGRVVGETRGAAQGRQCRLSLTLGDVLAWSPDSPHLYRLELSLRVDDVAVDDWSESFGFRTFEALQGQFLLNGEPFYMRGALDQDYYPDGICTPPSLEFLEDQLRKAKQLGLNCLRCHIKVPDPRYYEVADRLGMLVWTEIPNFETFSERSAARLRATMAGILARDRNHPSIAVWTLINEDWGTRLRESATQRRWLAETFAWLKQADPTRLVVDNSPCAPNFHVGTDINDFHYYRAVPERREEWDLLTEEFAGAPAWTHAPGGESTRSGQEPRVVSEFGVWGLPNPRDLVRPDGTEPWWFDHGGDWGDGTAAPHGIEARFRSCRLDRVFGSLDAFIEAAQWHQFANLKYQIESLRAQPSIAGYVVTEFTDVHWEANGLLDMQRNPRVFASRFAEINADTVLAPRLQRWAYWAGETLKPRLQLAAGRHGIPAGCMVSWRLGEPGDPAGSGAGATGRVAAPVLAPLAVAACPEIRIPLPASPGPARMIDAHFTLHSPDGSELAVNRVSVALHPARDSGPVRYRVAAADPGLAARLSALGYRVVDAGSAEVVVTATLDAAMIAAIHDGARVLLLAATRTGPLRNDAPPREPPCTPLVDDLPGLPSQPYFSFPGVKLVARHETIWRADWIMNFGWLRRSGPFGALPGGPMLDLTFDRVVPRAVMTGLRPWEYDGRVKAGVVVGWVQRPAATIIDKRFGDGRLVATTFRLTEDPVHADPTATLLLDALIETTRGG